jgi:glycosyltransferase involved in cell wall biosynthesis
VETSDLTVILLTNYVPPYRVPLYRALKERLPNLCVLVSTTMDAGRPWAVRWEGVDVLVQRSLAFPSSWRHPSGFEHPITVHIPYDTLWRLLRMQPHVVISGELGARTFQASLYRVFRPRTRLIVWATLSEHTERGWGATRERVRRWIIPRADAVLVNGASGARYVEGLGASQEKVFVAPYTTDMEPFLRSTLQRQPDSNLRLLISGQLLERKGLVPFFRVLSRWAQVHPNRGVEIWLLGDGPLRSILARQSLPPNVDLRFLGSVGYEQLPDYYAQAGILAFPTLADEWGLVVNEALASGMPVLGSVFSQAVEELVKDGETGWTFRPDQPENMYEALDRALTVSPTMLESMRIRARQSIQDLTPDHVADRIMEAVRYASAGILTH